MFFRITRDRAISHSGSHLPLPRIGSWSKWLTNYAYLYLNGKKLILTGIYILIFNFKI